MPLPAPFTLVSAADSKSGTDYRTLYTVPAGKQAFIKSVIAANATTSTAQPTLQLVKPGDNVLLASPSLAASAATNMLAGNLVMAAGESLRQKSDKNTIIIGQDIGIGLNEPRVISPDFKDITKIGSFIFAFGSQSGSTGPYNSFIFTSSDGINWNYRDPNPSDSSSAVINSAAYGSGIYVLVGDGGFISTSTDAITWTKRTSALSTANLTNIIFAAGKFVCVGSGGTSSSIQTSTDGITWTSRTSPTALNNPQITYDPSISGGLFAISTGAANGIHTSPDGLTWTQRASSYYVSLIQSISGKFIAKTNSGNLYSSDGVVWFEFSSSSSGGGISSANVNIFRSINGVLFFGNVNNIYYTYDGLTWVQLSSPGLPYSLISYIGSGYLVSNGTGVYKLQNISKSESQTVSFTASVIEVSV